MSNRDKYLVVKSTREASSTSLPLYTPFLYPIVRSPSVRRCPPKEWRCDVVTKAGTEVASPCSSMDVLTPSRRFAKLPACTASQRADFPCALANGGWTAGAKSWRFSRKGFWDRHVSEQRALDAGIFTNGSLRRASTIRLSPLTQLSPAVSLVT